MVWYQKTDKILMLTNLIENAVRILHGLPFDINFYQTSLKIYILSEHVGEIYCIIIVSKEKPLNSIL